MKAIVNGKILTKDEVIENKILLFDEKIIGFVDEVNEDMEIIDGKNLYISPGLIDLHIHGSANYDTMDNINTAVEIIGKSIIKNGVTSFLPTTMTMSQKDIYNALNLDGGGSTTMVAKRLGEKELSIINSPSGGSLRKVTNALRYF